MKIFTIYDSKAEAFLRPFFCPNKAVALREFQAQANSPESVLNRYPSDFTLFEIGEFNEQSAEIVPSEAKVALGTALEYVDSEGKPDVGVVHLVGDE